MFFGHHFDNSLIESQLLFESDARQHANQLAQIMREHKIDGPVSIGKIINKTADKSSSIKNFVNKNWKDPINQTMIIETFKRCEIDIYELPNKEKRIRLIRPNQRNI